MRLFLTLLFCTGFYFAQSQVSYMVICNNETQKIEIIKESDMADRNDVTELAPRLFPNKAAATNWKNENYNSDNCNSIKTATPATPVAVPPPAKPDNNNVAPPPEKNVEYFYRNKFAFYGNILFGTNTTFYPETNSTYFQAGINFRKGNKVQYGFDASFQGWGKVDSWNEDDNVFEEKLIGTASIGFLISYPVAIDKKGKVWFIPEASVGVDFWNVLQAEKAIFEAADAKVAVPSFFLRVGIEAYHVRPFFYYGRTMISVFDNIDHKFNNIGVGAAIAF